MAVTIFDIKNLLNGLGKRYFSNDDHDMIMLPCRCGSRTVHVVLQLQNDGRFLQLISSDFTLAAKDAPNAGAVFEEMLAMNFETKFIKIGRDPSDSKVVGYGDLWVEDGELTEQQLDRMLGNFVSGMSEAQQRLEAAAATGKTARDRQFDELMANCVAEFEANKPETPPDESAQAA